MYVYNERERKNNIINELYFYEYVFSDTVSNILCLITFE